MHPNQSCAFTGHRPEKLPWGTNENDPRAHAFRSALQDELLRAYEAGYRHFICGMARGADLIFCASVLLLRERYADVTLEAAIPFAGQATRWVAFERKLYQNLLSHCDFETVIAHSYSPGCMQRRNRYLVDHATRLIAAYNGLGGGTLYTIQYALAQKRDLFILDV